MHIFEYYIQIYDELQILNEQFELALIKYNKSNSEYIEKNNEKTNLEKNIENIEKNEQITEKIINEQQEDKNIYKKTNIEQNTEKINSVWIKKILLKLLFIYHPDKNINPNERIFSSIKNDFENNNFSSLFYYFIKEKNNPFIKQIFNEISSTKYFLTSIQSISNLILQRINQIKSYLTKN